MKWHDQWQIISKANNPIKEWLYSMKGNGSTLVDIGAGAGVLSEIAKSQGFKTTSIDTGNTPYVHNLKKDVITLEGEYQYLIAAGFPPLCLPTRLKYTYYIYTTSRVDFKDKYEGKLYYDKEIWIRTNLEPLPHWKDVKALSKLI